MERGNNSSGAGKLFVVGLGPGSKNYIVPAAFKAIKKSDIIIGYINYIRLIKDLINGKKIISSGMRGEIERAKIAIEYALHGYNTSLVSRGDPGVYGMAGLVFEICKKMNVNPDIKIIPGITAGNAAAALLGAPLMCDYAVLNLSDLLIPWEKIRTRLISIAKSDLVAVIYNPKSRNRPNYIVETKEIFMNYRDENTPVGVVKDAFYSGEMVSIRKLSDFLEIDIDMRTIVVIGNSLSDVYKGWFYTKRGYKL